MFQGLRTTAQISRQVHLNRYTQKQGLSSYYITKIIKDHYGFLWIGTQEGLNLFDGQHFTIFSRQSDPNRRLGGSFVADIAEDASRNILWVLTAYGDITGIDLRNRSVIKKIIHDQDGKPLSQKWVRSLAISGDTLFIGGLGVFSAYNLKTSGYVTNPVSSNIRTGAGNLNLSKMVTDIHRNIWLFSEGQGIIILNKACQEIRSYTSASPERLFNKGNLQFWDACLDADTLFVCSSQGAFAFNIPDQKLNTRTELLQHLGKDEIHSITKAGNHNFYIALPGKVLEFLGHERRIVPIRDPQNEEEWLSQVYVLFYDPASGKLWVGTQAGLGAFSDQKTPFTVYQRSTTSQTRIKHAYSLCKGTGNEIWCGEENGIYRTDILTGEIIQTEKMAGNYLLFRDRNGNIFSSNKKGIFLIKNERAIPVASIYPELKVLQNDQFNSAIDINDSTILLGSLMQKGVTIWNRKNHSILKLPNGSSDPDMKGLSIVNNLYLSKNNEIFILTEKDISILNLNDRSIKHIILESADTKTPILNLMDICESSDKYYIATYGDGIAVTDKSFRLQHLYKTTDGLSNNCVYRVFIQKDKLVCTTNFGLSILNTKTGLFQNYYESDGLQSAQFEQLSGFQEDGLIYAGGVNGFSRIDLQSLEDNKIPPTLFINNIILQTKNSGTEINDILTSSLDIPTNIIQVTINLSGLNFSNPERTRFEYKINEENSPWINLNDQHIINLPALPHGKYNLLFRAFNESGVPTEKPLELTLNFLPKWYQTFWLKLFLFLLSASVLYAFYRFRLKQINVQQQIRKDIASDLHDDIGSVLNSVKIFTHLARKEPDREDYLTRIEDSLSQATLGLRDMIWVLDDGRDSIYEVMERIKKFAQPVCMANEIQYDSFVEPASKPRPFSKTEKRNYLLIAKESINNSIKYAACKNIKVNFSYRNGKPVLQIKDDGIGFDPDLKTEGNGLRNIRQRAAQIQADCQIITVSGKGTEICISKK